MSNVESELPEVLDEALRRHQDRLEAVIVKAYKQGLRDGGAGILRVLLEREDDLGEAAGAIRVLADEIEAGRV